MTALPIDRARASAGFIDLHQDMLSGVDRFDGGFPDYGSRYLAGPARAVAVWSSLYPDGPDTSLIEQLHAHGALLESHSTSLRLVSTLADLQADDPRTGVLPHSEGLRLPGIGSDALDTLWSEHSLRSLSLTWNHETDYGFSCYDDCDAPLKPAGRELLRALEQSPIFLDLAHLNDTGFHEALDLYAPPMLVTHTSCRGVVDHPRGLSDGQLRALGDHGGLVGLAFYPDFLGSRGSVDEALRHIDRIASLAGASSVSIGSDWGVAAMGDLHGPSALAMLFDAVRADYGSELADRFAFTNAYEFLSGQLPRV